MPDKEIDANSSTTDIPHVRTCVILLLLVHTLLVGFSATRHSPTALEGPLLAAGVCHWELGRYELYRVNPPLVRMVAAIPVMLVGCETNWTRFVDGPRTRPEYSMGSQFIEINGERSLWLMTFARWACIPFSLIGGIFCFIWARELYGRDAAGLIAVALWCFCPLILGNAELITNDVAATSFGIVAGYYFWRWLKSPTWTQCLVAALALTFAILAKTTWLFLFGLWPVMAVMWFGWKWRYHKPIEKRLFVIATQMVVMFLFVIWAINCFYGFDGSFDKYGSYSFVSKKLGMIDNKNPLFSEIPVPLPRQFLIGLDTQISDLEKYGQMSYLAGEWREEGRWNYYLYGLWVKWPHGTQLLLLLSIVASVFWTKTKMRMDEWVLVLPALSVLFIVSSQTEINIHFRYVLPFVGLAFIFMGKTALLAEQSKIWKTVIVTLVLCSAISSMAVYPHSLAYFNELAGGPRNGHKHMLHSALDWGQDLTYLKWWLEKNPDVKLDGIMYHGGFDPSAIGLVDARPPEGLVKDRKYDEVELQKVGPLPGWYAISANSLFGPDEEYEYFRQLEPHTTAGQTIYVFHISLEGANRMRKELGLAEIE